MAIKTVFYSFTSLKNVLDSTLTSFSDITIDLPESSKSFISVKATLNFSDTVTVAGNYTRRDLRIGLGGGTPSTISNTATYTNSGENIASEMTYDFTGLFTSQWSGATMSAQAATEITQAGSTQQAYASLVLQITYSYDPSSTTQVKSVMIPLNAPVGDVPVSKGSAIDTLPVLNTYLPESTKSYKNMYIVLQGNTNRASTTNSTIRMELDSLGSDGVYSEGSLASDIFHRYIYRVDGILDPTIAHNFFLWNDPLGRLCHQQVYLVVTYTYDESASTQIMNSLFLPMEIDSTIGYNSTRPQRATRDFFIQEGGILQDRIAFYCFWEQAVAQTGLNLRTGSGSFITYTDRATQVSGNNAAMIRSDANFTLIRGRNTLSFEIITSTTVANSGAGPSGFWLINYKSDKHPSGSHYHNTSTVQLIGGIGNTTAAVSRVFPNIVITSESSPYYFNSIGMNYTYITNTTGNNGGVAILVERRTTDPGGVQRFESGYVDLVKTDPETGIHNVYSQSRNIFSRWVGDPSDRIDQSQSRDYLVSLNVASFDSLDVIYTRHLFTYPVSGDLVGFGSSTVDLELKRVSNDETVLVQTQIGDGPFTFDWYDNTEDVYVLAKTNPNIIGRSLNGQAGSSTFDVDITGNVSNIIIEIK
jgi:hypothetical protein